MKLKCSADYIEELINNTPDGAVCSLNKQEYYIGRRICVKIRKTLL